MSSEQVMYCSLLTAHFREPFECEMLSSHS